MDTHSEPAITSEELLVAELHRLGVRHLARLATAAANDPLPPAHVLAALAAHPQARLQGALILLFLRQPPYAQALPAALAQLDPCAAVSLKLYYQAAVYLQRELAARLRSRPECRQTLPDLFSAELGLPAAHTIAPGDRTAQAALAALGQQHARHSGWRYNWAGSYRQHVAFLLKHLWGSTSTTLLDAMTSH